MTKTSDGDDEARRPASAKPPSHDILCRLIEENHGELLAFLRRRLDDPEAAADLAQDLYARIAAMPAPESIRAPRAFLFQAARNLLADRRRGARARRWSRLEDAPPAALAADIPSPEQAAAARERLSRLERAIADLPPRRRAAFALVRFEELSYAEAAARLGVSVKTIEYHMREALRHIRERVDAEEAAPARKAAE